MMAKLRGVLFIGTAILSGLAAVGTSAGLSPQKTPMGEILKKYRDRRVADVVGFRDRYVLIESTVPSLLHRFDLHDLETGEMDSLPTMPYNVRLHRIVDENRIIFHADGSNTETPHKDFPFILECVRPKVNLPFQEKRISRYLPVSHGVVIGSKNDAALIDIWIAEDGVGILFGPAEGRELWFYAGTTDIPRTKTEYLEEKNQLVITFEGTRLFGNLMDYSEKTEDERLAVDRLWLQTKDNDTLLFLDFRKAVVFYSAKIGRYINTTSVTFVFSDEAPEEVP